MKALEFNRLSTLYKIVEEKNKVLLKATKQYIDECFEFAQRQSIGFPLWLYKAYQSERGSISCVNIETSSGDQLYELFSVHHLDNAIGVDATDGYGEVWDNEIWDCDIKSYSSIVQFLHTYFSEGWDAHLDELYEALEIVGEDSEDYYELVEQFCNRHKLDYDVVSIDDVKEWQYDYSPVTH